ncbi:4Fe-4S dicluster domain-containing protein [Halomonas nitroreducens]|uniref:4Fe-4S dicluster domain-containing protein n=1 Tax=Halomonas nitroreducens TaxID=447425 RepID=A0A431V6C2_9GAMM|nr:4Fe-4S dicluster domain-containing protein [Halomonas nitroreducens]RTR05012.1 4Fe-4S dicluster domain-containing protein [Halomonas nitroreducens]
MNQRIDLLPVDEADEPRNRQARDLARRQLSWPVNLAPETLSYVSEGHALLLGNERDVRRAARALANRGLGSLSLLITEPVAAGANDDEALLAATDHLSQHSLSREQRRRLRLSGYLGCFTASLDTPQGPLDLAKALADRTHFDLVIDLGEVPCLGLELPPPGYLAFHWEDAARDTRLTEAADLVGEFDKPRYVQVDAQRCAHAANGQPGCTRCLEVCPADAIASRQGRIEAWIEIDPYRCHGVGSCASACPTGAISYRQPTAPRQLDTLLGWLSAYLTAGGRTPVVRFLEAETLLEDAAGHVIDIPLEELGAAGHDQWLAALAGGAAEVRLQYHADMPDRLRTFLDDQLALARGLLSALGHAPERLVCLAPGDTAGRDAPSALPPLTATPLVLTGDDKRARLDQALDRLAELGTPDGERHALPAGAPYGGITVNQATCTLCMACVATCPTPALGAGRDAPRLDLREADCVQCGLCEAACPEDAIRLTPGLLTDPARGERRVLHEEAPFPCIHCGKPFASAGTIAAIKAKLADHPHFAGDAARRLEMCEDCRVRDAWRAMARDPDAQLKV